MSSFDADDAITIYWDLKKDSRYVRHQGIRPTGACSTCDASQSRRCREI